MSLNNKLNKLFESKFKKIEEEEIEENNVTGGGEAYDTPKAFKKKSKAIRETGEEGGDADADRNINGNTVTKTVRDPDTGIETVDTTPYEDYMSPRVFKKCNCDTWKGVCQCKGAQKESAFKTISKQMFLGEVNYKEYKTDESLSQRQKVNKSIKEVNGKLFRIERIIDQNIKLKTESGIDESKYWESTKRNLLKIEGKMTRLAEKLRSF